MTDDQGLRHAVANVNSSDQAFNMARFPQEILEFIVNQVSDINTLKTTSLLCRSLTHCNQRRLFDTVYIDYEEPARAEGVRNLLSSSKRISSYVRTLVLRARWSDSGETTQFTIPLTACTLLRRLGLRWLQGSQLEVLCSSFLPPGIEALYLEHCTFGSHASLAAFLNRCQDRRAIAIDRCTFGQDVDIGEIEVIPVEIQSLVCIHGGISQVNASLYSAFRTDCLSNLDLQITFAPDLEFLEKVMKDSDRVLTSLRIDLYNPDERLLQGLDNCLSRAKMLALRRMTLVGFCQEFFGRHQPANWPDGFFDFSVLSAPHVEHIEIDCSARPSPYSRGLNPLLCSALDGPFSSIAKFPSLTEVTLLEIPNEFHKATAMMFPRAEARGLLVAKSGCGKSAQRNRYTDALVW